MKPLKEFFVRSAVVLCSATCVFAQQQLDYSMADLPSYSATESPIAFYTIAGSYFSDFNLSDDFARAILATPNYGLAVLPNSNASGFAPEWKLYDLSFGQHLGVSFLASIPVNTHRWLTIIGDPTLRLQTIATPTGLGGSRNGGTVNLTWTLPATPDNDSQFNVYKATTAAGPYTRVNTTLLATGTTSYPCPALASEKAFMVRAIKRSYTGRGCYWNASQSAMTTVN